MSESFDRRWFVISALALGSLLIHLLVSTTYGLHRDAFLYLAESAHPAWGYLSIPPLTPTVARLWQALFGSSVTAIRMIPAMIGALSIIMIGKIVIELGGRSWAILLACLAYLVSPAFLRSNTLFQPVSFDAFFWLLGAWAAIRLLHTEDRRWWLALGVIFGLGFLNKYSMVFPVFSFAVGLALTPQRRLFRSRWLLFGLLAASLMVLPNLYWQFQHNWPVMQHMTHLRDRQLVHVHAADFLVMQFFMIFSAAPVFLAGLIYAFSGKPARPFRALGWTYVTLLLLMIVLSGKSYYTLGIYPVFFAFGGVALTRYTGNRLSWIRPALAALMILVLLPLLPLSLPVLSYPDMVRYSRVLSGNGMEDLFRWEDGTPPPPASGLRRHDRLERTGPCR